MKISLSLSFSVCLSEPQDIIKINKKNQCIITIIIIITIIKFFFLILTSIGNIVVGVIINSHGYFLELFI